MWHFIRTRLCSWTNFSLDSIESWRTFCWLMPDPMTLSETIVQVVHCDNWLFECWQKKCWESSSTLRQFIPPMLQLKHMVSTSNDHPMQIDKTRFKPLVEHENQCWRVNNLCLYYGKVGHIVGAYLNKCVQHVATPQFLPLPKG